MKGLGDNVYQRPFIKALSTRRIVYLETPWPELYSDLPNVRFVRTSTKLRTQQKNEKAVPEQIWSPLPRGVISRQVSYGSRELQTDSIPHALERLLPLNGQPADLDIPTGLSRLPKARGKPIAFVRPVTVRREWLNAARNPDPAYVAQIAKDLRRTHHVVLAADLEAGEEDLVGALPPHDEAFLNGELRLPELLGFVAAADVVVGGVGWIVPVSIALRRPCFVIMGGHGAHNAPERLVDARFDLSGIAFAMPDRFCLCERMLHQCDKTNTRLAAQWATFRRTKLSSPLFAKSA